MKLIRNDSDKAALLRIQSRCKQLNPDVEKALSVFLFRLLTALEATLATNQWEELATRLTSDRLKRKRKLARLKELLEKVDDSDIEKFEAKIERRYAASNADFTQKTAEIS